MYTVLLVIASGTPQANKQSIPVTQNFGKYVAEVPTSNHKGGAFRIDPNPPWVKASWNDKQNAAYVRIRTELDSLDKGVPDNTGMWKKLYQKAYDAWYVDCLNPQKLFRATMALRKYSNLDPSAARRTDLESMRSSLDDGFSYIRKPPSSYEYVRLAYIFNAGDMDFHKYNDLSKRLLTKNPKDVGVALAMSRESRERWPTPDFISYLDKSLLMAEKSGKLAGVDWFYVGDPIRAKGYRELDHAKVRVALGYYERAKREIESLPRFEGFKVPDWLVGSIKDLKSRLAKRDLGIDQNAKGSHPDLDDPQSF